VPDPSLSEHVTHGGRLGHHPPSIGEIPPSGMHIYVMLSCAFLAIFIFLFGFMGFRLQSSIDIGSLGGGPLVFGRPSLQLADFTLWGFYIRKFLPACILLYSFLSPFPSFPPHRTIVRRQKVSLDRGVWCAILQGFLRRFKLSTTIYDHTCMITIVTINY